MTVLGLSIYDLDERPMSECDNGAFPKLEQDLE